jgi:hypothetical protein
MKVFSFLLASLISLPIVAMDPQTDDALSIQQPMIPNWEATFMLNDATTLKRDIVQFVYSSSLCGCIRDTVIQVNGINVDMTMTYNQVLDHLKTLNFL